MSFSHNFTIQSDPNIIDLTEVNSSFWQKAVVADSIATFFPYSEVQFNDAIGVIADGVYFSELLKLSTSLFEIGSDENKIDHDFFWSDLQMPFLAQQNGSISGVVIKALSSYYRFLDSKNSKSYQGNISSILPSVIADYNIPSNKQKISTTQNSDFWYRGNQLISEFILNDLVQNAYSSSSTNAKSPFLSFINLNGEFYFQTLQDIFNQETVADLTIFANAEDALDAQKIVSASFVPRGYEQNQLDYKKRFYIIKQDGSSDNEISNIQDHAYKQTANAKFPILTSNLSKNFYSIENYGIRKDSDNNNYKGYLNYLFSDVSGWYRIKGILPFNHKIVSGKIVNLNLSSQLESEGSTFFSGKWIVMESRHAIAKGNGQGFTQVMLGKSAPEIRNNHTFFSRFLS